MTNFEKEFPKPNRKYSQAMIDWEKQKESYLAALNFAIGRRDYYVNVKGWTGAGAASQTICDIEKEIQELEKL